MTLADFLTALVVLAAVGLFAYYGGREVGLMQGRAHGFEQCLGQQDDDAMSTKVWRASK